MLPCEFCAPGQRWSCWRRWCRGASHRTWGFSMILNWLFFFGLFHGKSQSKMDDMENLNLIAGWYGKSQSNSWMRTGGCFPPISANLQGTKRIETLIYGWCLWFCYSVFCDYRTKRQYVGCGNCTPGRRYVFLRVVVVVDPQTRNPCQIPWWSLVWSLSQRLQSLPT